MKKGFFSHQLCLNDALLKKHVLYMTADNKIDSFFPFQREISLTTFCEGVLFVVSSEFEERIYDFSTILQEELNASPALTVGEAILSNPVYKRFQTGPDGVCALYSITSINWVTGRLMDALIVERIV